MMRDFEDIDPFRQQIGGRKMGVDGFFCISSEECREFPAPHVHNQACFVLLGGYQLAGRP